MATYTDNYNLVKPTMAETADIRTINGNMDSVDNIMHATQVSMAPAYDSSETYNTGDIVMYEFLMYECLDDEVTGTWDATKWQRTTAGEHGGGGGGSDVEITPTLQSGTKIADFEIDGVSGALYAPSGGGGGGGGSDSKIVDTLWEGTITAPTTGTAVPLSHKVSDYDVIVVTLGVSNATYKEIAIFQTDSMVIGQDYMLTGYHYINTVSLIAFINYTSDTSITVKSSASATPTTYYKIQGIKFGGMLAPMIYSLEEREVGVWVDDKPLYAKSVTTGGTAPTGTTLIQRVEQTDYDTLYYTKDSDVAGSGSYGSLGVPMEHYDNTEKVVGTYFGKTLYEKSYQNVAGTGTSVNVTLSDLSNIETIFIVPEASASTDAIPFPYVHYSTANLIGGFFTISNGVPTLAIRRGSDMASVGLKYLTVRYTKTTD